MPSIRSELWCAAFVRRHNNLGHICVISRRGDSVAGQVWVEVDHIDGSMSLFTPAPSLMRSEEDADWAFIQRFERVPFKEVANRIRQEAEFDPDFWLITLESRTGEHGLKVISA